MFGFIRVALVSLPLFFVACSPAGGRPPGGPGGPGGAPPPEATAACKSLAENAACSVKMGDKTLEGTCKKGPEASAEIACMPANPPPGGPGGPGGHGGPAGPGVPGVPGAAR